VSYRKLISIQHNQTRHATSGKLNANHKSVVGRLIIFYYKMTKVIPRPTALVCYKWNICVIFSKWRRQTGGFATFLFITHILSLSWHKWTIHLSIFVLMTICQQRLSCQIFVWTRASEILLSSWFWYFRNDIILHKKLLLVYPIVLNVIPILKKNTQHNTTTLLLI